MYRPRIELKRERACKGYGQLDQHETYGCAVPPITERWHRSELEAGVKATAL